jgi:hypothetical protein
MAPDAPDTLPLSALLAQALVAFTIECDNEAEHRVPHRTTRHSGSATGSARGTWLVSLVMWASGLRFVGEEPITVAELERRARVPTNLDGLRRWGYVRFSAAPGSPPPPATGRPGRRTLIAVTPAGRRAQGVWEPLPAEIEQRWRERFSETAVDALRRSLGTVVAAVEGDPPDCLPILGYGLWSARESPRLAGLRVGAGAVPSAGAAGELPLFTLLSRALMAFAAEYEAGAPVSLAEAADVMRVVEEDGTALRDLPARSGVAFPTAADRAIGCPAMLRSAPIDGFSLAYERQGSGPPVVVLHGWPGDHRDWREVLAALGDDVDAVAPDLRGFGSSDKLREDPARAYSATAQAASVLGLIDELGLRRPVLAGYDVGSRVAQAVARTAPDRVGALVIAPPLPGVGNRVLSADAQREFWYQPFHRLELSERLIDGRPDAVRTYLEHFWTHWSGPAYQPDGLLVNLGG